MKKLMCFLLTVVLLLSSLLVAQGESAELQSGVFRYQIVDGGAVILGVGAITDDMAFPATLGGCPVVAIGDEAMADRDQITTLTLPDTVTHIGKNALKNSSALQTIHLPKGLKSIGDGAFSECMALKQITIPASVESIGNGILAWCGKMTEIKVEANSNYFTSIDGVLFDKAAETLIAYPRAKEADYIVPDGVKEIRPYAFHSVYGLAGITFPDSLLRIGEHAFNQCSGLSRTVTVPSGVTVIEPYTFYHCKKLEAVALPNGLLTIGRGAFQNSQLADVAIPATVTSIGAEAFSNSGIQTADIPKGVAVIGDSAFSMCNQLTTVTLREGLTHIGEQAFTYSPSIQSIHLPVSLQTLGKQALAPCAGMETVTVAAESPYFASVDGVLYSKDMTRLVAYPTNKQQEEYTVPQTVTRIEISACQSAKFTKITLPQNLALIDDYAFAGCGFAEITLPDSLTHIGSYAFERCKNITHLRLPPNVNQLGEAAFYDCASLQTIDLPPALTALPEDLFAHCAALQQLAHPANLTEMGAGMLNGCASLREVVLPKGIPEIPPSLFWGCRDLTVYAENVTTLGEHAFHGCNNLTLIVSDRLTNIMGGAFYWADGIIKGDTGSFVHRYIQQLHMYGDYHMNFEPRVGIAFDQKNFSLSRGQSGSPAFTVSDETAPITWESADPAVATVENGVVTALSRGRVRITARMTVNGQIYQDACTVIIDPIGYCDVDGDQKTTAADALAVLRHTVGKQRLSEEQQVTADLDEDGHITANDALMILKIIVNKL